MKLKRASDVSLSELPFVENPFFASSDVRSDLQSVGGPRLINYQHGDVRLSTGHAGYPRYTEDDLLRDVKNGRVLLVKNSPSEKPFDPLVEFSEDHGKWMMRKESPFGLFADQKVEQMNRIGLTPDRLATIRHYGQSIDETLSTSELVVTGPDYSASATESAPTPPPASAQINRAPVAPVDASTKATKELSEPGFHVVPRPMSVDELKLELHGDSSAAPARFEQLNPNLKSSVLPGQMIVLGDADGAECTVEEAQLMDVADQVNRDVDQLSEDEAEFLVEHYDLLKFLTSTSSAGLGAGSLVIGQQIKAIQGSLKDLEQLHQTTYAKYGNLNQDEFYRQRKAIFKKLDFSLGSIAKTGMSLDENMKLKRSLGLSSKSIVHHWDKAGVGDIPGYSTHYDKVASAAKWARAGGILGITLDGSVSALAINEACTAGSDEECTRVKFAEVGRFSGSVGGGAAGALAGTTLCVAVGLGTGGVGGVACMILAGGAGSVAVGSTASSLTERFGDVLYESIYE